MFKKILLLLLFSFVSSQAQIIVKSNHYTPPVEGNVAKVKVAQVNLPLPALGSDITWDFSSLTFNDDSTIIYSYNAYDNNTNFPSASFQQSYLTKLGNFTIDDSRQYYKYDETGLYDLGFEIHGDIFSLMGQTGGAEDQLSIHNTVNNFADNPITSLKFPLQFSDKWTTNNVASINFDLTVSLFQLNAVPGQYIQDISLSNEVVGWGKIIVANNKKIPVLLLKSEFVTIDSAYLGGSPAPAALLGFFNIQQGKVAKTTRYSFFAANDDISFNAPLAELSVNENTQMVEEVRVNAQAYMVTGIKDDTIALSFFPNPAESQLNLTFSKESPSKWDIIVYNVLGQSLKSSPITSSGVINETINLENITKGTYFVVIKDESGSIVSSKEFIKK